MQPVAGADLRAAFVASVLRGALPPVDVRADCFVRGALPPVDLRADCFVGAMGDFVWECSSGFSMLILPFFNLCYFRHLVVKNAGGICILVQS